MLLRGLQAINRRTTCQCRRAKLCDANCPGRACARCKHENRGANRMHGDREAPNQALGACKPHLDGLVWCRQVRCHELGQAAPVPEAAAAQKLPPQKLGRRSRRRIRPYALGRACTARRHQPRNQHAVAENAKQVQLNPHGRQQQPCVTVGSCTFGFTSAAAPERFWEGQPCPAMAGYASCKMEQLNLTRET